MFSCNVHFIYFCVGFISDKLFILCVKYLPTRLPLLSQILYLTKKVYLWELVVLANDKLLAQDSQAKIANKYYFSSISELPYVVFVNKSA